MSLAEPPGCLCEHPFLYLNNENTILCPESLQGSDNRDPVTPRILKHVPQGEGAVADMVEGRRRCFLHPGEEAEMPVYSWCCLRLAGRPQQLRRAWTKALSKVLSALAPRTDCVWVNHHGQPMARSPFPIRTAVLRESRRGCWQDQGQRCHHHSLLGASPLFGDAEPSAATALCRHRGGGSACSIS